MPERWEAKGPILSNFAVLAQPCQWGLGSTAVGRGDDRGLLKERKRHFLAVRLHERWKVESDWVLRVLTSSCVDKRRGQKIQLSEIQGSAPPSGYGNGGYGGAPFRRESRGLPCPFQHLGFCLVVLEVLVFLPETKQHSC